MGRFPRVYNIQRLKNFVYSLYEDGLEVKMGCAVGEDSFVGSSYVMRCSGESIVINDEGVDICPWSPWYPQE